MSDAPNRDDDPVSIPRWAMGILAEELAARTTCGGDDAEPLCPMCEAIRLAKEASE